MSLLLLYQSGQAAQSVTADSVLASGSVGGFFTTEQVSIDATNAIASGAVSGDLTNEIDSATDQNLFATAIVGTISDEGDASNTGSFANAQTSSFTPTVNSALGGVSNSGNTGTLTTKSDASININGISAIGSAQAPTVRTDASPVITGINATGSVTKPSTSLLATMGGMIATAAVAPLTAQLNAYPSGIQAFGLNGFVAGSQTSNFYGFIIGVSAAGQTQSINTQTGANLANVIASAVPGSIAQTLQTSLGSNQANGQTGTVTTSSASNVQTQISGMTATNQFGALSVSSNSMFQQQIVGVISFGQAQKATAETDAIISNASAVALQGIINQITLQDGLASSQASGVSGTLQTTSLKQIILSAIQSSAVIGTIIDRSSGLIGAPNAASGSSGEIVILGGTKSFMLPQGGTASAAFGTLRVSITPTHGYRKAGRGAMNTTSVSRRRPQTRAEDMRQLLQKLEQQAAALQAQIEIVKRNKLRPPNQPDKPKLPIEPKPQAPEPEEPIAPKIRAFAEQMQAWKEIALKEDAMLIGDDDSDEVLLGIL